MSFYEVLDNVFDNLHNSQKSDNLVNLAEYKQKLIYVYENENSWRCTEIKKLIIPRKWYIDEIDKIHSVD